MPIRLLRKLCASFLLFACAQASAQLCRIEVIDKETGWPVPLVELRTTHQVRFVSDNAGLIAFDLPESMGQETWFDVIGHGYDVPKDGYGSRGVRLTPKPGATLKVEVKRALPARRIGRLTGAGLFAESQKLGLATDWRDAGIFGCDSVQTTLHNGRLYWLWGDTTISSYALGIFHSTGATTPSKPIVQLEPPLRFPYDYIRGENGQPRAIAKMPGDGPSWATGYISLPDKTGKNRLVCAYTKIVPPLEAYQWGLAVWNDAAQVFEPHKILWTKSATTPKPPPIPKGHVNRWRDPAGKEWILFGDPLPILRCPATFEAWEDPSTWEVINPQENLPAANSDRRVVPHSGSIAWNPWRQRWITVFMEKFGKPSAFGELWYAEADSPTGPWGTAVKVLSHENYTFYNPRIHPEFTPEGTPLLFFEGTYTAQFADKPPATPRYDYNQILYRLDLDDLALAPAQK